MRAAGAVGRGQSSVHGAAYGPAVANSHAGDSDSSFGYLRLLQNTQVKLMQNLCVSKIENYRTTVFSWIRNC